MRRANVVKKVSCYSGEWLAVYISLAGGRNLNDWGDAISRFESGSGQYTERLKLSVSTHGGLVSYNR